MLCDMTQIILSAAAAKQLNKLPTKTADKIMAKLEQLAADPRSQAANVKALQGSKPQAYRLRVGDYRAIFQIVEEGLRVTSVRHRSEVYR